MTFRNAPINPVLVSFAVREEAQFFKPPSSGPTPVRVCLTGIGRRNAVAAVQNHLGNKQPRFVLSCGFAGGLNPSLARNTIVFSSDEELRIELRLLQLGAISARFHCSERIAITAAEKRRLWETTGADAVEMESEAIRKLCRERGIPSATIRVISDAADEDLPLDFNALLTPDCELSYFKLVCASMRSPRTMAGLLELRKRATTAAKALAQYLERVITESDALVERTAR